MVSLLRTHGRLPRPRLQCVKATALQVTGDLQLPCMTPKQAAGAHAMSDFVQRLLESASVTASLL